LELFNISNTVTDDKKQDDSREMLEHDDIVWTVDPNNNSPRVTRIVASLLGTLSALRALRALRASGNPAGLY
jgi:hypothetical protein